MYRITRNHLEYFFYPLEALYSPQGVLAQEWNMEFSPAPSRVKNIGVVVKIGVCPGS